MTWRLSEGGGGGKAIGEVLCGNGEVCQDFAKSAGFPAKKCEPKCESSLPKCESHLPKLWIRVPIRQKSVNRCESMAKSLAGVAVPSQAIHGSRFTAGFEISQDFS